MLETEKINKVLSFFCKDSKIDSPFLQEIHGKQCLIATERHILIAVRSFNMEDFKACEKRDIPCVSNVLQGHVCPKKFSPKSLRHALSEVRDVIMSNIPTDGNGDADPDLTCFNPYEHCVEFGTLLRFDGNILNPYFMDIALTATEELGNPHMLYGFRNEEDYMSLSLTSADFTIVVAGIGAIEDFSYLKIVDC